MRKALFTHNRINERIFEFPFGNIAQDVGPSPGGLYDKALQVQQQRLQVFFMGRGDR